MPVDSEVAKERIWKEHCEKTMLQSVKAREEGRGFAQFTLNPFHLHHNKPVTDPVSLRSPDFLDRHKATLESLSNRLTATGLSPRNAVQEDVSSPQKAARINKNRAVKGNNIFGSESFSAEAKRKLFEEWSEKLNEELGGGKTFRDTIAEQQGTFLPPLNSNLSSPSKQSPVSNGSPSKRKGSNVVVDKRDEQMQELLLRSSQVPSKRYERPLTESQAMGWEAHKAFKPDPMFQFGLKMCEMTRFAAESGHSPTNKKSA